MWRVMTLIEALHMAEDDRRHEIPAALFSKAAETLTAEVRRLQADLDNIPARRPSEPSASRQKTIAETDLAYWRHYVPDVQT